MSDMKQLIMKLELSFWSLTIRLLSESKVLRSLLPGIYGLFRWEKYQPGMRMALFCSLSGFLVGVIVGVLTIL